jgi:hypothetical protein
MQLIDNIKGNYKFLTGIAPYSSGVVAMSGYEIVHATFHNPLPYQEGFKAIERHLTEQGRSRQALCAIVLRSPKPVPFDGFADFNGQYQSILNDWDLLVDGMNPIARTNVAPAVQQPDEVVLYGFSYTMPTDDNIPSTFIVAGAGDLIEGNLSQDAVIRANDSSVDAIQEKAAYVMSMMEARLNGLQVGWAGVTMVDIYTIHGLKPFLESTILAPLQTSALHGVHWYYSQPPISGLDFEMDMRGVRNEVRLM